MNLMINFFIFFVMFNILFNSKNFLELMLLLEMFFSLLVLNFILCYFGTLYNSMFFLVYSVLEAALLLSILVGVWRFSGGYFSCFSYFSF